MSQTVTVPEGITAAQASTATLAAEKISTALKASATAGAAVLVKQFGGGLTLADEKAVKAFVTAVRLAGRASHYASGKTEGKPRGAQGQLINATISRMREADAPFETRAFVLAARSVLDARAAVEKAGRERRAALAEKANDHKAAPEARREAFDMLTTLDSATNDEKKGALITRLSAAILAAHTGGIPLDEVLTLVSVPYGVTVTVSVPEEVDA